MYYACQEHIELALDVVVDEKELAPVINKIEDQTNLSTTCSFCEKEAIYTIST